MIRQDWIGHMNITLFKSNLEKDLKTEMWRVSSEYIWRKMVAAQDRARWRQLLHAPWAATRHKSFACKTRLPSNLRQDHLWMRALSYACSLLVMWQRWRLHCSSCLTRKPHAACKHHVSMFDRMGVIADKSLCTAGTGMFDLFSSCDLDLDLMTFIYELNP